MRRYSAVGLVIAGVLATTRVNATTTCQFDGVGQLCTSQVDFQQFAQTAFMDQYMSEWCWAASISMIFAFYGHPVSEAEIVSDVYGVPANIPAQGGIVIANELNKSWVDDLGQPFASTVTAALDAMAGVDTLTNQQIASELDQNHPLVLATVQHAMVLTMLQYYATSAGPEVVGAGVFDPWPGNGARLLSQAELIPYPEGGSLSFVATVRVSSAGTTGTGAGGTTGTTGHGGGTGTGPTTSSTGTGGLSGTGMGGASTSTGEGGMGGSCSVGGNRVESSPFAALSGLVLGLIVLGYRSRRRASQ